MKAEIISIGTELLLGEITDTNASYLAGELPKLGIDLFWVSQVGDNRARLLEVFKRAWGRSDIILATGGLGPTVDDLTRETIAEMIGETPVADPALEEDLRERFGRMGVDMPSSNLKQIEIIPSARAIPNPEGTAPGWWVERDGHVLVAMPGPPRELHPMWENYVKLRLPRDEDQVILTRTLKIHGFSEAAVGELVADMLRESNPTLGIYAKLDGIHLRIAAKAENASKAKTMMEESEARIREIFQDQIWGTDDDTPESVAARLMKENGLTLAVMEDYSGGWLTVSITDMPGSSDFFKGSLIATTDEVKIAFGIDADLLKQYGAVSPEAARAMAEAARKALKADIGISSTALKITDDRPMGTAYIGISDGKESWVVGRPRRKQQVSATAMLELRKILLAGKEAGPDT